MPVKSADQEQNQSIVNWQRIEIGQPGSTADRVGYPGGLADSSGPLSPHLCSRQEVGEILRASGVEVIELRASIVIGSGS
jgi:hypothetical protein